MGELRRIDVDQWLLDLNRACRHVMAVDRLLYYTASLGEHAQMVRSDPAYRALTQQAIEWAQAWEGTAEEFRDTYAGLLRPLLFKPPRRGDSLNVSDWARRLASAEDTTIEHEEAMTALRALIDLPPGTGDDDVMREAWGNRPVLAWEDFEDMVRNAEPLPVDHRLLARPDSQPGREREPGADQARSTYRETAMLGHLSGSLEMARGILGLAALERNLHPNSAPHRFALRELIPRALERVGELPTRWLSAARPSDEVAARKLLAELGYPPPVNARELSEQVVAALRALPEDLDGLLTGARAEAERLKELTGTSTVEDAVRVAKKRIAENRPNFVEPGSRGVVVYSGGLPTLGKR